MEEIIKFGTVAPVKFEDYDTKLILDVVFYGHIKLNQELSEDQKNKIQSSALQFLINQIEKLSGTIRFTSIFSHTTEFSKNATLMIEKDFGIQAQVNLLSLTLTEESKSRYDQVIREMLQNRLANTSPAAIPHQNNQQTEKSCPSCGTTSSGKFCPSCGTKLC